jgi:hypothetical protein
MANYDNMTLDELNTDIEYARQRIDNNQRALRQSARDLQHIRYGSEDYWEIVESQLNCTHQIEEDRKLIRDLRAKVLKLTGPY